MKDFLLPCLFYALSLQAYNARHVDQVLQIQKQKQSINASRCDFRGIGDAFKGLNFSGMQFSGALFDTVSDAANPAPSLVQIAGQKSDLTNVNFSNASLVSTSFQGAVLQKVNFAGADISYANFAGADLTGAKLDGAQNASLALFCGAIMPDGTKPTSDTWTSPSGKVFYLRCSPSS